jgi:hypothetical protein
MILYVVPVTSGVPREVVVIIPVMAVGALLVVIPGIVK